MNRPALLAALAGLMLVAAPAHADRPGGYYLSVKALGAVSPIGSPYLTNRSASVTYVPDDTDPETVAGPEVAFGYRMKNWPVRLEAEWIYRYRFDLNVHSDEATSRVWKSNVGTQSLYWNAYYDHDFNSKWTVYGGAGIGVAVQMADTTYGLNGSTATSTASNTSPYFSWHVDLGGKYHFNDRWALDISNRITSLGGMDTGDTALGRVKVDSYYSYDILIGATYSF
jgi:opacity protein-like surface antigen